MEPLNREHPVERGGRPWSHVGGALLLQYRIHLGARTGAFSVSGAILVSMKKVLLRYAILICVLSNFSRYSLAETPEAKTLLALAPRVYFLCDFAMSFHPSPESVSSWKALQSPSLDTGNLIRLLKSGDPKIRSLAIFALDRKNDPHVLPEIADLLADRAPSYGCPMAYAGPLPQDKPETWPREPGTVGDLATEVVRRYLSEAGYASFADYWKDHKDRNYSLSWFALGLRRVWSVDYLNHPSMDALRHEISQLPSPDRQWTVLWLGTLPNPNNVVRPYSEDEQVRAATELGHESMLQLLDGHIQSTDPDLRSRQDPVYSESLEALQTFVLKHSAVLLALTDRDFLLQEKFNRFVWYAIGAARLDRKNTASILHAAYDRSNGKWDGFNRAILVLELWNWEGQRETRFILDWFYDPSSGPGLFGNPRDRLLTDAEGQENAKLLVATIIRDPRFDTLDWNCLNEFVWVIRRWIGRDFFGYNLEGQARSEDHRVREDALADSRRRIRSSIPLWLPKDSSHISRSERH